MEMVVRRIDAMDERQQYRIPTNRRHMQQRRGEEDDAIEESSGKSRRCDHRCINDQF